MKCLIVFVLIKVCCIGSYNLNEERQLNAFSPFMHSENGAANQASSHHSSPHYEPENNIYPTSDNMNYHPSLRSPSEFKFHADRSFSEEPNVSDETSILFTSTTTGSTMQPNFRSSHNKKDEFCQALGQPQPNYVAVVSRWDEDISWTYNMPIKTLIYEHEKPESLYNVKVNKGSETSAYIQFILDHYSCIPKWTLFLHAHGQTPSFGKTHAAARHHPTDPTHVAALVDVESFGRYLIFIFCTNVILIV